MTAEYQRIADDLYRMIANHQWKVGDRLPTIAELHDKYDVRGVQTIRSAYGQLIEQGLVEGRQGAGYFLIDLPDNEELRTRVARLRKLLRSANGELAAIEKIINARPE